MIQYYYEIRGWKDFDGDIEPW